MLQFLNPRFILEHFGLWGTILIIFAESGLFFGFFFPGDSLLFTAGLLASQGYFSITVLAIGAFLAAILGDSVGYAFGKKMGPKLFTKDDSLFFKKAYVHKAQQYFDTHGSKTIILARFVPIVRTFAPIVAGVGNMKYGKFLRYNIIGGTIWGLGISLLGYFLGSVVPSIDKYLLPIILLIILTSLIPVALEFVKKKKA